MIEIVRIVGESYDFRSGAELGKGFVLSNGISERMVEATPEQITTVLELYGELEATGGQAPEPAKRPSAAAHKQTVPKNGKAAPARPAPKEPVREEDDELEPGEAYQDENGTQSI